MKLIKKIMGVIFLIIAVVILIGTSYIERVYGVSGVLIIAFGLFLTGLSITIGVCCLK